MCWCGLLAKWLRVRARVRARARAGARDCTRCTSFFLFFSSSVKGVVNTFVFVGSASARRITYECSIDDVAATRIVVNLVSPLVVFAGTNFRETSGFQKFSRF